MRLTEGQAEALFELFNIAFGRATASFAELAGQRVLLETPSVAVYETRASREALLKLIEAQGATVRLDFTGPVAGDALLVLEQADAALLVDLLLGAMGQADLPGQEVLLEVGNILLHACIGALGDLLPGNVRFSAPDLYLGTPNRVIDGLIEARGLGCALAASTTIRLQESAVSGLVLVVMDSTRVQLLVQALENVAGWTPAG